MNILRFPRKISCSECGVYSLCVWFCQAYTCGATRSSQSEAGPKSIYRYRGRPFEGAGRAHTRTQTARTPAHQSTSSTKIGMCSSVSLEKRDI